MASPTATDLQLITERLREPERARVREAEMEALGYARGRMDALHDAGERAPIDPIMFALSYALHVADGVERMRDGRGASIRPIHDHWSLIANA